MTFIKAKLDHAVDDVLLPNAVTDRVGYARTDFYDCFFGVVVDW